MKRRAVHAGIQSNHDTVRAGSAVTMDVLLRRGLAVLLVVWLVTGAIVLARELFRPRSEFPRRVLFLAIVVAVVRLLVVPPSYVHANLHGSSLAEAFYAFPDAATHRPEYGAVSFLVLGAITELFGEHFRVVVAANTIFASLSLAAVARLAYELAGSRRAGYAAVVLGALHPGLARVAASEDAHALGAAIGFAAIVAGLEFTKTRAWRYLFLSGAALVLTINTRQTFYLWGVLPVVVWWSVRRTAPSRVRYGLLAVLALGIASTLLRAIATVLLPQSGSAIALVVEVWVQPALVVAMLLRHPLLDVLRVGPFLPLCFVFGLAGVFRKGPRPWAWFFALDFLQTLAFGLPAPGNELQFRTGTLLLGLAFAGGGAATLTSWLEARTASAGARRVVRIAAVALGALVYPAFPGWRWVTRVSADYEEQRAVAELARSLPREIELFELPTNRIQPSSYPPLEAFRSAGVAVVKQPHDGERPLVFVAGIRCAGYSFAELLGSPPRVDARALDTVLRATRGEDPQTLPLRPPAQLRPECACVLEHARPIGEERSIEPPLQDFPFVIYPEARLRVRLYEVTPEARSCSGAR